MANEVVARHGISISGKTYISTVDLNNSIDSILVLNGSEVQYREVSTLPDNSALIYNTPTYPTSIIPTSGSSISTGTYSTVGGGGSNTASNSYSTVGGGGSNIASGVHSTVSGGLSNTASGSRSTVGGGGGNDATGCCSTVSGGLSNTASGTQSTVSGGGGNDASGDTSTVGGGQINTASGISSTIGGGGSNTASGTQSTVSGGLSNTASGSRSTIGGGYNNTASGSDSTVGGGYYNTASGCRSTVGGGGIYNTASGVRSGILGGKNNLAQCTDSFIIGSDLTATTVCTTFMNNVSVAGGITGNTITAPSSGAITFNGEYSFPTTDGSANTVLITDGSGNLSFGDIPNTFVTGGTYSDGTATFTNNTGGTFNVSGFFTSADTINIYTTDSTFTSERFANLDGNKLHLTGGTVGVNVLDFVPTDTPPTGNQGQVYFDSDFDTLTIYNSISDTSLQVGQEMWFRVKNQSGSNIPDGTLVQASGADGNSGRITIVSGVTDGTYPNDYIMGITTHSIGNGEDGWVTEFGVVKGIDTSGQNGETWGDGTILYGDPNRPGGLTSVRPSAPNNINSMAIVLKASPNGTLFVRPTFDHNLEYLVTGATDGQVITYNDGTGTYQPEDPNNIYNNDGTLDSDRIVDQDTNHLTFSGDSGVSIGTGTTSPVCALLELASTTQGLLIPRMTQEQRLAIPSPQPGLLVYCTDNTASSKEGMYMYKSLGWVNVL